MFFGLNRKVNVSNISEAKHVLVKLLSFRTPVTLILKKKKKLKVFRNYLTETNCEPNVYN